MTENETMSLCPHHVPVKLGCNRCEMDSIRGCIGELSIKLNKMQSLFIEFEEWIYISFKSIENRLKKLELFQDITHQEYKFSTKKKPHKCPICNGSGEWELQSIEESIKNNGSKIKKCHSCEGKGIVWG